MGKVAAILAFSVLIGVATVLATEDQTSPPTPGTTVQPRVPVVVPVAERLRPNPVPAEKDSIEYGKLLYSSQCTMCHGLSGAGDGELVERYGFQMPDLTNAKLLGKRTDGELFWIITNGHKPMPEQGDRYPEKVRWDIVNYVRTIPEQPEG